MKNKKRKSQSRREREASKNSQFDPKIHQLGRRGYGFQMKPNIKLKEGELRQNAREASLNAALDHMKFVNDNVKVWSPTRKKLYVQIYNIFARAKYYESQLKINRTHPCRPMSHKSKKQRTGRERDHLPASPWPCHWR